MEKKQDIQQGELSEAVKVMTTSGRSFSNAGNSEQEKNVVNVNTNSTGEEQKVNQKRNKSKEKGCLNVKRATKIFKINEVCGLQL